MGDGRIHRTIEQGKVRTSELKERVPDLKDELKERIPELKENLPELGQQLRSKGGELREEISRQYAKMDVAWARRALPRAMRELLITGVLGPMIDFYTRRTIHGREVFDGLEGPVIFVANHSSHLDAPTVMRALPYEWRSRTAVGAAADYFYKSRWKAAGVSLLLNTVPLGRHGGGLGNGATDHVDRLIGDDWNLLLFPEGTRSRDGSIGKVRSGAAVIAAQHQIRIVPIYLGGLHAAMPAGQNWPKLLKRGPLRRRHKIEIRFGSPLEVRDVADRRDVMDEVRAFWERKGIPAEQDGPPGGYNVLLMHEVLRKREARFERPVEAPEHAA